MRRNTGNGRAKGPVFSRSMRTLRWLVCGLIYAGGGVVHASAASATASAPDRGTPGKSLSVFFDAVEAEDYAAVRATFAATTKPTMAAADDMAAMWVCLHHYHRVMTKRFPGEKPLIDDQVITLRFPELRAQAAKVTFTIQGNHATASEFYLGTDFVFDGHIWQVNMDKMENVENYLNEKAGTGLAMARFTAHLAIAADSVAVEIETGKMKTYDEAAKAVKERMARVQGQITQEFKDLQAAAALDLSTPEKTMAAFLNAIEKENRFALRATLVATTKPGLALADDLALLMVSSHRFHRVLDKKFPDNKVSMLVDIGRAAQMAKLREALAKMTFKIDGNRATASDNALGLTALIRNGKTWQLDCDNVRQFEKYPLNNGGDGAAMIFLTARAVPVCEATADDIEAGKLADMDAVKKAMEERGGPILERVEKELKALREQAEAAP